MATKDPSLADTQEQPVLNLVDVTADEPQFHVQLTIVQGKQTLLRRGWLPVNDLSELRDYLAGQRFIIFETDGGQEHILATNSIIAASNQNTAHLPD